MSTAQALPRQATAQCFAIVCFGYARDRIRRQPWHVARGLAEGLAGLGHAAAILTDATDLPSPQDHAVVSLDRLVERGRLSGSLREQLLALNPDRVFLVTGARELARLAPLELGLPVSLVMASPRLTVAEIARLGPAALWRERGLLALPVLNALLPGACLRRGFARSGAEEILYLSHEARRRYVAIGLPAGRYLPPQVDPGLCVGLPPTTGRPVVTYFGPALALRGADLALAAFETAVEKGLDGTLELLLRPDGVQDGTDRLLALVASSPAAGRIHVETRRLEPQELRQRLARAHVFLLPFIAPVSEVPLVVIEAGLSGRPVVVLDAPGVTEAAQALGGIVASSRAALPSAIIAACARQPGPVPAPQGWTRWDRAVRPLIGQRQRQPGDLRLLAICGVDGSGKTTILKALRARLEADGLSTRHVWSRFRNYTSKPLLALARLTGHNRKEQHPGFRIGYHEFAGTAYARPFLALQALDSALDAGLRYRGGGLILADRCILDTLVDLCIDTGLDDLVLERMAPVVLRLLPRPAMAIVLTRPAGQIAADRPDAVADRAFARRRALYARLATRLSLPVLANDGGVEATVDALLTTLAAPEATLLRT